MCPSDPEIAAVAAHDDCEVGEGVFPLFDPFLEYLYFRFGFTFPPEGPEYPNIQSWSFPLSDEDFSGMQRCVYDQLTAVEVTDDLRRHLFHFVTLLSTIEGPPASLWDLHTNEWEAFGASKCTSERRCTPPQ